MMEPISTPIIRRRVNIDFESAKTPGWHPSRRELEDFLNAISFVFPPGEKFFIESVQNYQDKITDPVLKEQVKRFIYQEAMHTKEHNRANRVLDQSYPYGNDIEKFTGTILSLTQRFTPKAVRLAVTCALEHFTAILAELLLRNQEQFIAESDPAFAALWLWHAVEEAEHKAVCFDVYRQVVGKGPLSYIVRAGAMVSSTLCFLLTLFVAVRLINKQEKQRQEIGTTGPSTQDVASKPRLWPLLKELLSLPLYLDYYRPSFHPWDHDNRHLIAEWKKRYRTFGAGPDGHLHDAEEGAAVTAS